MAKIKITELVEEVNELTSGLLPSSNEIPFVGYGRSEKFTLLNGYGVAELKLFTKCLLILYRGYIKYKSSGVDFNKSEYVNLCNDVVSYFDTETDGEKLKLRAKLIIETKNCLNGSNPNFALPSSNSKGKSKIKILGLSVNKEGLRLKLQIGDEEITITEFNTHRTEK